MPAFEGFTVHPAIPPLVLRTDGFALFVFCAALEGS